MIDGAVETGTIVTTTENHILIFAPRLQPVSYRKILSEPWRKDYLAPSLAGVKPAGVKAARGPKDSKGHRNYPDAPKVEKRPADVIGAAVIRYVEASFRTVHISAHVVHATCLKELFDLAIESQLSRLH